MGFSWCFMGSEQCYNGIRYGFAARNGPNGPPDAPRYRYRIPGLEPSKHPGRLFRVPGNAHPSRKCLELLGSLRQGNGCKKKVGEHHFWLVVSNMAGWFSILYMGCHPSHWLMFFKMVKTTNQILFVESIDHLLIFYDKLWMFIHVSSYLYPSPTENYVNAIHILFLRRWRALFCEQRSFGFMQPYTQLTISEGWTQIPILVGGLEHGFYFSIYWESYSQLTNSIIFQRGGSTTNQH